MKLITLVLMLSGLLLAGGCMEPEGTGTDAGMAPEGTEAGMAAEGAEAGTDADMMEDGAEAGKDGAMEPAEQ